MLMQLGQDFPTPNPLFHDQKHAGKIPSTFDGIYNMIHPMPVTAPAGKQGCQDGCFPGGRTWNVITQGGHIMAQDYMYNPSLADWAVFSLHTCMEM